MVVNPLHPLRHHQKDSSTAVKLLLLLLHLHLLQHSLAVLVPLVPLLRLQAPAAKAYHSKAAADSH